MSYQAWAFYKAELISEIQKSPNMGTGVVLGYAGTQFDSYPAVTVTPAISKAQFADTARNQTTFVYNIMCLYPRLNQEQLAEDTLTALCDDIAQRLANNSVLNNNTSTFCRPVSTKWGYGKVVDVDTRNVLMQIEIEVVQ